MSSCHSYIIEVHLYKQYQVRLIAYRLYGDAEQVTNCILTFDVIHQFAILPISAERRYHQSANILRSLGGELGDERNRIQKYRPWSSEFLKLCSCR